MTESEVSRDARRVQDRDARRLIAKNAAANPVSSPVSKGVYLDQFDASKNGPLNEQVWCRDAMHKFHSDMRRYNQGHCVNCRELWPTTDCNYSSPTYICRRYKKV